MEERETTSHLPAEVERLRSESEDLRGTVDRLQQERDLAYGLLAGLEYLGQRTKFWDGTPERLPTLAARIREAFDYRAVAFSLFEAGTLRRRAIDPPDAQITTEIYASDLDRILHKRHPVIVFEGEEHTLIVPLLSGSQRIGVIEISLSGPPTKAWISLWRTLAIQVTSIITGGRQLTEIEANQRLQELVCNLTRYLAPGMDLNEMLADLLAMTIPSTGADGGSILLLNDKREVVRHVLTREQLSSDRKEQAIQTVLDSGLAGWIIENEEATVVTDTRTDERWIHLPDDPSEVRSALAVPLQRGKRISGLLFLVHHEPNHFGDHHLVSMSSIVEQAAIAVENAFLLEQTQQRIEDLDALNKRVREERATLEAIINGTSDAIVVTDTSDRVLFFNPAARRAFLNGESLEAGRPFSNAVHNQALLDFWDGSDRRVGRSTEIPLGDGRTFNASMTHIVGVGKVAVMQDITHLKEMDRIKSEFVSTVSHDLRSPLQVVQTSAELLPRLGDLNLDQRKEVERILIIVRRMSELVRNLLDIGRIEAGMGMDSEPCAMEEIIASAAGSFRSLAQEKGLDLTIDLPKTLPLVNANALRLDQVISNLVSNAIKFTPEGSVSVSARAENGAVICEVVDTGIGIPLDAQEELFEKFYRVKSPQTRGIQGTGLGLTIAKSIVESYGGRIEVESYPRLGSTFRVILPACAGESNDLIP
jgi:two-component system NtrC family sensor kinase